MTGGLPTRRLETTAYRAHNPRWAFLPTSGEGAARRGGRFNPTGVAALYLSLDPKTAWMEAQQGFPFKPQPMTLVAYQVACEHILDLTDRSVQRLLDTSETDLACPWEDLASRGVEPTTWRLTKRLIGERVHGILVPGFAPGCGPEDRNIVLWDWSAQPPCRVIAIDDEHRLPADDASWN